MAGPKIAPYGSWKSPITSELIVSESISLGEIVCQGEDIYWLETRPAEGGRNVIVRRTPDGETTDMTPRPFSVRTRVHEYGGGAFSIADGTVHFSNFSDQRLYCHKPGAQPQPMTPEGDWRYADAVVDSRRGRIICVREDHPFGGEVVNALVGVCLEGNGCGEVLVSGRDFYSSPRLSPDGSFLAWLCWDHPNMPWDGTELWVGEVQPDGSLGHRERVAGGEQESIFQPEWSPEGSLAFVTDRTGWWNLHLWRNGSVEPLLEMEAEFGVPQWVFGLSTYAFVSAECLICAYHRQGGWHLAALEIATHALKPIGIPYTQIASVRATPGRAWFLAGSPTEPASIVQLDLVTHTAEVVRRSIAVAAGPDLVSVPQTIEFPTEHGLTAHAFFYPPHNGDLMAPSGEQPPLLVRSHGGPTSATSSTLDLEIQYWTSRGLAVLDVNYGGSTGYGRPYRQRLEGQWGVVDVDDCVNAARYLVDRGQADGRRLLIRGGSAGGYTALAALTFRDVFRAGASYYGVSDLEALAKETHKFESRYLDRLIGPYPERQSLYLERSPIHFTEQLSCPVIFFQGDEDRVVPPDQAEMMVEALRAKRLPVAYVLFQGEQHGFRRAENIRRALDAELYFYSRVFGFDLAEPVEPVTIENL